MTLLEILLHELEGWPEGKEYAFQSTTTSRVYFVSSDERADADLKGVLLCQIASERGLDHIVTQEEWRTAKIKSLPFFKVVASTLGEERAVKELLAVSDISDTAQELDEAFAFADTPQGYEFWSDINDPSRGANRLRQALRTITAALKPESYLQLHADGSGTVRDSDDNEIISFDDTDSLVSGYLKPTPKFEHWDLLQERFQWIAKDQNGEWWAYEGKPILSAVGWKTSRECRSLEIVKVGILCHWSTSLIERPSHS